MLGIWGAYFTIENDYWVALYHSRSAQNSRSRGEEKYSDPTYVLRLLFLKGAIALDMN